MQPTLLYHLERSEYALLLLAIGDKLKLNVTSIQAKSSNISFDEYINSAVSVEDEEIKFDLNDISIELQYELAVKSIIINHGFLLAMSIS
ncbi:unnamed protein product [Rhizophagus irregularis]|nr:unnamed protein product [Rhizophagus irregularis]